MIQIIILQGSTGTKTNKNRLLKTSKWPGTFKIKIAGVLITTSTKYLS